MVRRFKRKLIVSKWLIFTSIQSRLWVNKCNIKFTGTRDLEPKFFWQLGIIKQKHKTRANIYAAWAWWNIHLDESNHWQLFCKKKKASNIPVARRNSWGWKSMHRICPLWNLNSCKSFPAVKSHNWPDSSAWL